MLTRKAAHHGEAERKNYGCCSLVETLRHGERPLWYDLKGNYPFSLSCAQHLSAHLKACHKTRRPGTNCAADA